MTSEETLYDDGRIKVVYHPEHGGHELFIDGQFIFLAHGILEGLATTPRRELIPKFNLAYPDFGYILGREGLSYETMGLIIAQARIRELEKENHSYRGLPHYLPKVIPIPR
ncbi:hypothetical protein J4422_02570 [Candidatus Pacearchaeota archaeon]|nr:hypothetical protein [Candidatus Pacearchaeota archaeon]